jgi:hypothetical protein
MVRVRLVTRVSQAPIVMVVMLMVVMVVILVRKAAPH